MAGIKWEYTLTFILVICSALLLLLIGVQTHYGENAQVQMLQEIENVESAGFALQDIPDSPIKDNTLDEYSELVERPLFFIARQPIVLSEGDSVEETEVAQQTLEELSFVLIGLVNTKTHVYALFQDPHPKADGSDDGDNKFKRRKLGADIHNGWMLKEILSDHIIISSGKETQKVLLRKPRKHKAVARRKNPKKPKKTNPFKRKTKK